ncbi:MAG: hypothetical protein QM601_09365 [Pseudoxanthomonas sp.]
MSKQRNWTRRYLTDALGLNPISHHQVRRLFGDLCSDANAA